MKYPSQVIVSVTNDLITDQRVHRSCLALTNQGFEVILVGRHLRKEPEINKRPYKIKRFKLLFNKGALFYANYNIRLFFFLLFTKHSILFANDLDTLPANFMASKIKGSTLVYDSHEYFTGVPELEQRPFVKSVWTKIEKYIFPKLNIIITVNDSIAELYNKQYNKKLVVIRNVPAKPDHINLSINKHDLRKQLNLPVDKKILILQGSGINVQRGAEEAVMAMQHIHNALLIILGGGDVIEILQNISNDLQLGDKIKFLPRMSYEKMMRYTAACDLGLSFDKDTNLNYRFSLPNKIFDYIHAGIPVLASRLPEVEKIISGYQVGDFIENHLINSIASKINNIITNDELLAKWKNNLQIAASELCWENEVKKFPDLTNEPT